MAPALRYPIARPSLPPLDRVSGEMERGWAAGQVTSGKAVRSFEAAVERKLGVGHAVAVSSCTSGLMLAVKALGITGEVILPSFTFGATAHALVWNGVTPVFCDSDPETLNLDPGDAAKRITPRTSAIMPVAIFGVPCDVEAFGRLARRHRLRLLYDSAQALGAKVGKRHVGTFGDAEVFSLSVSKVVTSIEGGIVTTNDGRLAERLRRLRDYGKARGGEDMEFVGLSARMGEWNAVVGLLNLRRMREFIAFRKRLAALYRKRLSMLPGVRFQRIPDGLSSSWNYMVMFVDGTAGVTRDDLHRRLTREGIQTRRYFFPAVHEMIAYRGIGRGRGGGFPVAERVSRQGLALPLYEGLKESDVERICGRIRAAFPVPGTR